MTDAGFDLTHLYGLTETYGPATINEWDDVVGRAAAPSDSAQKQDPPGHSLRCARGADRAWTPNR